MSCVGASAHILACHFEGNWATLGGGAEIFLYGRPETIVERCTFEQNVGTCSGGAMFFQEVQCQVINCETRRNYGEFGGAFFCANASPIIMGCTSFADSSFGYGSSLHCQDHCDPVLISCTFAYGYTYLPGSVVHLIHGCNPIFERCIISHGQHACAIYPEGEGTIPLLRCCNLFASEFGDWVGLIEDQASVRGNMSCDPLFCNPTIGDLQLQRASPCRADSSACGAVGAWPVGCP